MHIARKLHYRVQFTIILLSIDYFYSVYYRVLVLTDLTRACFSLFNPIKITFFFCTDYCNLHDFYLGILPTIFQLYGRGRGILK